MTAYHLSCYYRPPRPKLNLGLVLLAEPNKLFEASQWPQTGVVSLGTGVVSLGTEPFGLKHT